MAEANKKQPAVISSNDAGAPPPALRDYHEKPRFEWDPKWGRYAYFFGVSNIMFSVWIVCTRPWDYWIWHIFKNFLYISYKFVLLKTMKWQWWLADFCYVVNYLSWLYFLLCYCKANIASLHFLKEYTDHLGPMLFRVAFVWSNGILAAAISLFSNMLIIHSPAALSSLAIHIGPPIVTWAFRWYSKDLNDHYPDTFHTGCNETSCEGDFQSLFLLPAFFYFLLWTIPYVTMLFIIFEPSINAAGCVTMFSYYRKDLFVGTKEKKGMDCTFSFLKNDSLKRSDGKYFLDSEHVQQLMYMATHAIMSYISFGVAWLCWFSFKFHTVYLIFQIHVAIWNGANAYFSKTRTLIEETNKEAMEKKAAKAAKAAKASGSGNEDNVIPATGR